MVIEDPSAALVVVEEATVVGLGAADMQE